MPMIKWIDDIFNLVYPKVCAGCNRPLSKMEASICLHCQSSLPERMQLNKEEVMRRFYGRVQLEEAYAFLFFKRNGITQRLLHSIKYKGNTELATEMGKLFGKRCKEQELYKSIDLIVPIPLHRSKMRFRGYNQSALIAKGLGEELGVPVDETAIIRNVKTSTQTRKSRMERWKNVEHTFETIGQSMKGKHVLIVDDVLTTGATLESCAQTLLLGGAEKLSIGCLAIA